MCETVSMQFYELQYHSYWYLPLIRFLVPVSMIICNDIMAYMFGFFFGKTPLIKLSPKKTWEGFIGGAFATIVFGLVVSINVTTFDVKSLSRVRLTWDLLYAETEMPYRFIPIRNLHITPEEAIQRHFQLQHC